MAELRLYEQELIAGQERVRENPTMLVPGAEQCKYCCKHACPAIKSEVVKVEKAQLKPKDMSNEQMAKALEIEPLITGYYKDMKAVAKQRLLDNKSEGLGHKLVKQTGNRVWGKLDELKKFIDDNLIDAYEEKIKSPAVLEKLVKKDKVVFDELQKFMVKPDKGFKMVKEGTKGDAYTPDTFGAIK